MESLDAKVEEVDIVSNCCLVKSNFWLKNEKFRKLAKLIPRIMFVFEDLNSYVSMMFATGKLQLANS